MTELSLPSDPGLLGVGNRAEEHAGEDGLRRPTNGFPREALRHLGLLAGVAWLAGIVLAAFVLPLPYSATAPDSSAVLLPPSAAHWFGTDQNGTDVLSRVIAAAKNDIPLALAGALAATVLGATIGTLASMSGRLTGAFMRALDLFQSLPVIVVALTIVALAGSGFLNVVIALGLIMTPQFIRVTRAESLVVRSHRFVEASEAIGAGRSFVTFRHVLPNVLPIILAQFSLVAGVALLTIAGLGFLGVGVQPSTPSWGLMLNGSAQFISTGQWWVLFFPAAAIVLSVLSFNALSCGLERLLDRGAPR